MNEIPKKGTKEYAIVDVISRPNAVSGLYRRLRLPLEWEYLNNKDAIFITHVADLADRLIGDVLESGKNLDDSKVQEELLAAFYGGATGAKSAILYHKFLSFFGFRK